MASRSVWLALPVLARRLRGARELDLACDFDGALAPIVDRPEEARMSRRTHAALSAMLQMSDTRVAVLSGRSLIDLKQRIGLDGAFLAGVSGLEFHDPDTAGAVKVVSDWRATPALRRDLVAWCARFPGAWLEDKGPALALHYRAVPDGDQPAFAAGVRRRVRKSGEDVCMVTGSRVLEILPSPGPNRAGALGSWLDSGDAGALVFVGDATAEEQANHFTHERGGIAVRVGATLAGADYTVGTHEEVAWLLEWLSQEWRLVKQPAPEPGSGVV
jgi:trehalose 6-phosphate synthase/phosphatase